MVLLGSAPGQVTGWSDTAVVATVAATAVSGVARIEQNGVWSNALTFTVPSGDNAVTLSPNLLTMLVGDTHTIQALNPSGQPVTGLTWTSSDPAIVSLSTADPPLLTALVVGHVTITAGRPRPMSRFPRAIRTIPAPCLWVRYCGRFRVM